jgi:hypothetical protein
MWFLIFPHPFSFSPREKPPQDPDQISWRTVILVIVLCSLASGLFNYLVH